MFVIQLQTLTFTHIVTQFVNPWEGNVFSTDGARLTNLYVLWNPTGRLFSGLDCTVMEEKTT